MEKSKCSSESAESIPVGDSSREIQVCFEQESSEVLVLLVGIIATSLLFLWFRTTSKVEKIDVISDQQSDISDAQGVDSLNAQQSSQIGEIEQSRLDGLGAKLPPILWILTDRDIKDSRLEPTFYGYHMQHIAQMSGFEARFVDHETAYRWLTQTTKDIITKAMHRRKYEVNVGELLRLALIVDNGGVILRPGSAILLEELTWIQSIFEQRVINSDLKCQPYNSVPLQLFMFSQKDHFIDIFIAGQKGSSLLTKIFLQMAEALKFGREKYPSLKQIEEVDSDTKSVWLKNPFQFLFNAHLSQGNQSSICQQFSLQSIDVADSINKNRKCEINLVSSLKEERLLVMQKCGLRFMINIRGEENRVSEIFRRALVSGPKAIGNYYNNSVIAEYFFNLEPISEYLKPINQTRNVHFCIVSLKTVPKAEANIKIQNSVEKLKEQTFPYWNAVYFSEEGSELIVKNIERTVLTASIYQGLNLQTAVTQHCPFQSIIFLLDFDEAFSSHDNLAQTSDLFSERSVYGAFVPLQMNTSQISPLQMKKVKRVQFHPNIAELEAIANHFRVFNSDYYCMISHNDLHNVEGEYYDRTIPLLGMMEMSTDMDRCYSENNAFEIKRMKMKIDLPEKIITLPFSIIVNNYKKIDGRKPEFNTKYNYLSFCNCLTLKSSSDNWLWNCDETIVFNLGKRYQSPAQRRSLPKIIPRKIHQIWIYGEPSPAKQYMMAELKRHHPQFQYILWSKNNITRENFPYTYDVIQTLFEFDKVSPYSKISMVSDFMRQQIIYQHGGFYFDTNYLWLGKQSLEEWLTYDLVMTGELYPRMYIITSSSPFGSYAKNPRLLRLLNPECISRIQLFSKQAATTVGPGYIKRVVRGSTEQNDMNLLKPSMEELLPTYPFDGMTKQNFCRKNNVIDLTDDLMFAEKKIGYYKNCSRLYPEAYGIDAFELGGSWTRKKW